MNPELERAALYLSRGELIIYPTETLYALGSFALNHQALLRIINLKKREAAKPLPVVIAGLEQLRMITAWKNPDLDRLIRAFWPGPLSILVPALPGLPPDIQDDAGLVAVRWTPHPVAQTLARICKSPLVSTSANLSGQEPVCRPEKLNPILASAVAMVLDSSPFPAGGRPSSLVRIVSPNTLEMLRAGAVPKERLESAGWSIRTNS
jgi:L-threonylcarbamoyladenylate synthase